MLISTRILRRYASKTLVARDWRVVDIPDEDAATTNLSILYQNICSHSYDALEPFQPAPEDVDAPLKAEIGSTQTSRFSVAASVCLRWRVCKAFWPLYQAVCFDRRTYCRGNNFTCKECV